MINKRSIMRGLVCVDFLVLACVVSSMYADESAEAIRLQKSVVKAQVLMSELPIELQAKQISVIESKDLLMKSNGNIQSVLESVPGIMYSRSGGINGQITFRGQNSNNSRSIVMIDGVRYSGRNTLEFNMLDPYAFESIEVIRGPASSLWGSDAMNGVINFRSRTSTYNILGESFKSSARIRALEYGSVNHLLGGRFEVLGGGNGFDVLVGLSAKKAQDYATPLTENGSNKAKNSSFGYLGLDFNAGYTTQNALRFFLQGRYARVDSHRAGGLGAAPGSSYGIFMSESPISEYYLRTGVTKQNLSFADSVEAYLYWRHWDTDIYNDRRNFNKVFVHQQVYNNNYFGGRIIYASTIGKHNLNYGAEFESSVSLTPFRQNNRLNNTSTTINRPNTKTDFALFAKDDFTFTDRWYLSASVRADYVLTTIGKKRSSKEIADINSNSSIAINSARLLDENGTIHQAAITGALGSVYFISDYISNVLHISHNFKAPSAGARMQTTPSGSSTLTVANPLIKSEYSQTLEFGFRFQSEYHFASLVGFYTYYTDMIALSTYQSATITTNNTYRSENIGRAVVGGIELEGKHGFLDGRLNLQYVGSYNYGQNLTDKKPIAYLAPLYGQMTLNTDWQTWYLNFTQRFYGAKTRIDPKEERETPFYSMTDVLLGFKLETLGLEDMELLLGVNNVFNVVGRNPVVAVNTSYAPALSNPLVEPGRNIFVKYIWKY